MKLSPRSALGLAAAVGVSLVAISLPQTASAQWEPERPIEFVIQTTPGGGSDKYARFWIGLVEKYKLSPQPIIPVNKPGGAGAVAMTHLQSKRGDPHYITPTLNSLVTTPLVQKIPVMYPSEDLTPIVKMMTDPFALWSNPNTFKTYAEFQEACKERELVAVMTGAKQEDEIQLQMIERAAGCKPFKYVPQPGGGDVATQVAGQHADFNVNQPREALPHYPDRMVPLVFFSKERAPEFPDTPTHYEVGMNDEWGDLLSLEKGLHQMRGVIGPPDISPEAIAWYEDLFKEIFDTQEWKEFMKKGAMVPTYMTSAEYTEWLRGYENAHVKVMRDVLGWELRDDLRAR